jgi:uncharacterized delta-60 repeat protein
MGKSCMRAVVGLSIWLSVAYIAVASASAAGAAAPSRGVSSSFEAVALQPDGYAVLDSQWETSRGTFRRIERRTANGGLDPTFGEGGEKSVADGRGLALRPDGTYLVGVDECGHAGPALILLDSSGAEDESFGQGGCAPLNFSPERIALESDGSVLVAGSKRYCPCSRGSVEKREAVLAKLAPNGALDLGFGLKGHLHLRRFGDEPQISSGLTAIAPTSDGGALVGIGIYTLRFDAAGSLDPGFAAGGKLKQVRRVGRKKRFFRPLALLPLPNGGTAVASQVGEGGSDGKREIVLTRLLPDGNLDPHFGRKGSIRTQSVPNDIAEPGLAPMPEEGILLSAISSRDSVPVLIDFDRGGELVPTYGDGGVAALRSPRAGIPVVRSLATAADGSALVVGRGKNALILARTPNGAPNVSFGRGGALTELG